MNEKSFYNESITEEVEEDEEVEEFYEDEFSDKWNFKNKEMIEIEKKVEEIKNFDELRSLFIEYQEHIIVTTYITSLLRYGEKKLIEIIQNRNNLEKLINVVNKENKECLKEFIINDVIIPREIILAKQKSYYIGRLFNQAKKSTHSNFNKLPNELMEHIFSFWNKDKGKSDENLKNFNSGLNFKEKTNKTTLKRGFFNK